MGWKSISIQNEKKTEQGNPTKVNVYVKLLRTYTFILRTGSGPTESKITT